MSLHVTLTPEAEIQLKKQKRWSSFLAFTTSMLTIALIFLLLAWVVLPALEKVSPTIQAIYIPVIETPETPENKILPKRQPASPPAAAMQRVIASQNAAPISVPVTDFEVEAVSAQFSTGEDDFGPGWDGNGFAYGAGDAGSAFGSTQMRSGALLGNLYDFKQDRRGKPEKYSTANMSDFADRAVRAQRLRFRDTAFRNYFKAPQDLYLTHLAIPFSSADAGPKFFEAEKEIKPSGWVAHYSGNIQAPADGEFRFVGFGDDYLVVSLDGRPRLFACWPDTQKAVAGRWEPSDVNPSHTSPFNQPLIYGDWVTLKKGQEIPIDIAVGERPGGKVGFVLLIEQRGVNYAKDPSNGRPILPLFATEPINDVRRAEIEKNFGNFRFEWDNIPVFGVR